MKLLLSIYFVIALALCTCENADNTPDTLQFVGLIMVILPVIIYKIRSKKDPDPNIF